MASQWLIGKESACSAGDTGDDRSTPGLGRAPGGGHGNLLQYSGLKNPILQSIGSQRSWTQLID